MTVKLRMQVKRIYDEPGEDDGRRVLVDRLWPRGISKDRAELDDWAKELAPSSELRAWYHQDREQRYDEFAERYRQELDTREQKERLDSLLDSADDPGVLTLLTAVKEDDEPRSHVPILLAVLQETATGEK
jgi:uncharacterized protein YeaO (DUF488 family)